MRDKDKKKKKKCADETARGARWREQGRELQMIVVVLPVSCKVRNSEPA